MTHSFDAYGLWLLVVLNSAVFHRIFALSFAKPQLPRDWRSFSAFSAFIVALLTKMSKYPLTIYLLSGWLQSRYPGIDLMSHDTGQADNHQRPTGQPHANALHIASYVDPVPTDSSCWHGHGRCSTRPNGRGGWRH